MRGDSGGIPSRLRGAGTDRSQGKKCDYCRITNRRSWETHNIDDCLFLKRERPVSSRAVEVEDDYDDHQAEFLEVYEGTPDPVRSVCIINHVIYLFK